MHNLVGRFRLDRRRVEEAHFQFAILQVASWYPRVLNVKELCLHADTQDTLSSVVPVYHAQFLTSYASKQITIATISLCLPPNAYLLQRTNVR